MARISMRFKPMSATNVSFMNTDNNQTLTDRTQYGDITAEQYIEGILLTFICLVSVLGNISIWIIVLRSRALRTITNCFLLVLSAFDLLVSFINIPVTILTIFSGEWFLSDGACIVFGFTNMLTLCGSVLSLCNISINRYVMVCHPSKFIEVYKRKNVATMIIASIAVTIGVSVPPLLGWCEYSYTPSQYICFANWPMSLSYSLFMICCCFGVPLVVMIFCNYKIYRIVKTSKNKIMDNYTVQMSISKDESESTLSDITGQQGIRQERNQRTGIGNQDLNIETQFASNKSNRILSTSFQFKTSSPKLPVVSKVSKTKPEEIRLAIMLGTIVVVFFVCWFPYCISMILSIIVPGKVHRIFHMSTLLIGYFNSCCNPIIYGLLNKRFSDGFKKLYCFCRKRRLLNL
ncbi:melatonin receptor type 1B-B-like [Mytilus edulis]|uniref:melatonin receptor type 1B-B-like n=1 Tax=Mytilus edulis TaxID=6550 RepID=UPI0039F05556